MSDSIDIKAILHDIEESGGIIVRKYYSREQLARVMQEAIDSGRACAFVPSTKAFHLLYNTDGFLLVMQKVEIQLSDHNVIVEAGLYGGTHVFAVGPST